MPGSAGGECDVILCFLCVHVWMLGAELDLILQMTIFLLNKPNQERESLT